LKQQPLTLYGEGSQTRSFCYVSDLVRGIISLMEMENSSDADLPFNIGNPEERTVSDLARKVLDLTGSDSPVEMNDLPIDDPRVRCPDIRRAQSILGWLPEVSIDQGLATTIEYFRKLTAA
jgi:nucleoside-diphosphate-sugar epimerase